MNSNSGGSLKTVPSGYEALARGLKAEEGRSPNQQSQVVSYYLDH